MVKHIKQMHKVIYRERMHNWNIQLVAGCWVLVNGSWLLVAGCWLLVAVCWLLVAGCWV